ncbi:putative methyltransferase-domain-containing protein [Dactylonectria macrodidyma]|uniref:Methyltransferase-domain-containing protein n=1 Tax=Dactylonectria macrodidyma TaxID=307937 RepID=A0A9P9FJM9_9HYPO|nr:putative methyltransferase-domain-containing protein [Dactylonectria macrodidyma]
MSPSSSWTRQVNRFCSQYLQLEPDLDFPEASLLKTQQVQDALYTRLFADGAIQFGPPQRYQLRVLKELMKKVEASIDDWNEYGVSDELMSTLSVLLATPLAPEATSVQQKCYVTYQLSALANEQPLSEAQEAVRGPHITLLENRSLISAAGTTGLRTWEAALHLGSYLCQNSSIIKDKQILELGAGTGYLSILCANFLASPRVIASDGSDDVINNLPENLFLNNLQDSAAVVPMEVKWGHALVGTEEDKWNGGRAVDVVLGADITYDDRVIPALVGTLEDVFDLHPAVEVYIAATQRNEKTFQVFLDRCQINGLAVEDLQFAVPSRETQEGPFYNDNVLIRICKVSKP